LCQPVFAAADLVCCAPNPTEVAEHEPV
jgi:hypothetical protein